MSNDKDGDTKDRFLFPGSRSSQNIKTLPAADIGRSVAILISMYRNWRSKTCDLNWKDLP